MKAGNKNLSLEEQKKIVNRTNTGQIPQSIGHPGFNLNTKSKNIPTKTTRKRG